MVPRIHALADAFCHLNGAFDPQSDAYKFRNPLRLKAFSPRHNQDEKSGLRIFRSLTSGYDNGIIDLTIKCSGKSFSKIGPESTLKDLVCLYGNTPAAARTIKNFLQKALNCDIISETTKLGWFLESDSLSSGKQD